LTAGKSACFLDDVPVTSASDYHPFGWEMPGRKYNSAEYRYGFNGKEKDQNGEWGSQTHYDYGFRIYNPAIAKFLSVDPLAADFVSWSPYNYVLGNPVLLTDPDGRAPAMGGSGDPPIGAIIGGTIRRGYEQLKYSIWRNWTIATTDKTAQDIPYRTYGITVDEWSGDYSVAYREHDVEPSALTRIKDNTLAGLDLASAIPVSGSVQAGAKVPWWPFAKNLASKSELLADGGTCKQCAAAINETVGGTIIKIENAVMPGRAGIGTVNDQAGNVIVTGTEWKNHYSVFKDGRYYDGLTGSNGLPVEDYSKLFPDWNFLTKTPAE